MSTRAGNGDDRTTNRIEMRAEGRESLKTYEVVIEVMGRKTREGSKDARRRATPRSNQQLQQLLEPTPQRDRRIMLRTINRAHGREARDRIGGGEGEAKKRKKSEKSCRLDVGNGGDLIERK